MELVCISFHTIMMNALKLKEEESHGSISYQQDVCLSLRRRRRYALQHFTPDDYERRFVSLPGLSKPNHPNLKTDELGVCVFPSVHALSTKDVEPNVKILSARSKRIVSTTFRFDLPDVCHYSYYDPTNIYVQFFSVYEVMRKLQEKEPEHEETQANNVVVSLSDQASRKAKAPKIRRRIKYYETSTSSVAEVAEHDERATQEMLVPVEETCDEPVS